MVELIRFLDRDNWGEIKRGHVFDAVSYYNTDTRRPLTFFIPDEKTPQEGQPITGKLVESIGDFEPIKLGNTMKSPEYKVVVGMKQRRVVVLSNNRFSQDDKYEYIYVAPIMSVHEKDRGKKWYNRMIHDDHPTNIYIPRYDDGYERYISLAQIFSIHKGSLLRNVYEEIHEERLALVGNHLNYILDLGLLEPEEADLTARQEQVLQLIKSYAEETGYPPTRAEIARKLGYKSANAAEEHIKALAKKGAIEIIPGASRGIRLPESSRQGIPLVGRVAAGSPILAQEHIEDYCNIPSSFFSPSADYLLRVNGMSMKDVGILDGDLLAVHRTDQARNGQIVVARIGDEVTVKRFKRAGNRSVVELWPENPDFNVIEVDLRDAEFAIEGLSVGVIRRD